jgi:hypothetical protein
MLEHAAGIAAESSSKEPSGKLEIRWLTQRSDLNVKN